ncbi:MAG: DUF4129 domain-containing protein [Armatimonadetes bacterium]|nr:DUF4129 domain-containing protein [Armatimonadota bacterium]
MDAWDFRPPAERPSAAPPPPRPTPPPAEAPPEAEAIEAPPAQPSFDWLTEVLIPVAVFGLLASFFYYLIDLRGAIGDRGVSGLRWVCFWFLLGTILTTRMRSRYGAHILALPYMLGLALAMILFVFHVTMYSGSFVGSSDTASQVVALVFNYALVGVIWWIAGVVTRACTAEENYEVMEDRGLLTAARPRPKRKKTDRGDTPRHPGWVLMWTSLAALIIFALGQQLVGASSESHRRHAFLCMVSYSFFALVLLALTSLSSLRMSARKRRIRVATTITPVWAAASMAIVAVILAMAALLPRVHAVERARERVARGLSGWREPPETPWNNGPAWGSRKPRADAGGDHRADEDQGSSSGAEGAEAGKHAKAGEDDNPTPTGGSNGEKAGRETAAGSGSSGGDVGGEAGTGSSGGQGGEGASGKSGAEQQGDSQDGQQSGEDQKEERPSEGGGASNQGRGDDESKADASGAGTGEEKAQPSGKNERGASGAIDLLKQLLLWLLILLLLLLLLLLLAYLIYRAYKNRKNLPSFRGWLGALWEATKEGMRDAWARVAAAVAAALAFLARLFGWRPRIKLKEDGLPEDPFADIFADRVLAESLTPAQVVRHVYAAFQAFADLIGYARADNQTPYEFCRALPAYIGGMPRPDADDLTGLYVKAAYSPTEVGSDEVETVRGVWERMQEPIDSALAARSKPSRDARPAPAPA